MSYLAHFEITGTTALLQHRYGQIAMTEATAKTKTRTGTPDYSREWMDTMYVTPDGYLCQWATHIKGSMVKAATTFIVKGRGKKSWKEGIRAYAFIQPFEILHLDADNQPVKAPTHELMENPTAAMQVSVMRVVIQGRAVARARLQINAGWKLQYTIRVINDQLPYETLQQVVESAGQSCGIGDFRPEYGQFKITGLTFEEISAEAEAVA